MYPFSQLHVNI